MKRIGNLYDKLIDKENIKHIIYLASKGKKKRREVKRVICNIDYYADAILKMVETGDFWLYKTRYRSIVEKGKIRNLTISRFFPNRILDYLMVETLKPYIKRSMYDYCIGNVDGRGMIYGKNVIARNYKKYKYYIKLDIHKFYPSVKSQELYDFICTKIKDKRFLKLCKVMVLSESDLPIGSYYSQWFSNWYLQDLDHFIKEKLQIPFYIRYVDDMVLMGNNKRKLLSAMYNIQRFLKSKSLQLKRYEQVYTFYTRPLDFLGFRFLPDRIILRTRNFKKMNKRLSKAKRSKSISKAQAESLLSYIGWLKQIKIGYKYYKNRIEPYFKNGYLKRIVSTYYKKHNVRLETMCINCTYRPCEKPCEQWYDKLELLFSIQS